ncbi:MAG: hypothetical protein RLZZ58_1173, partial [Pseudomonadota bacterium]
VGFVAAGGRYAQRQNVDAIAAKGIEAAIDVYLGAVAMRARYAYTDATVRASGTAAALNGKVPAQIARHIASATLRYDNADAFPISGEVTVRYAGAQNEDDLGLLRLADAVTADAAVHLRLREGLFVDLRGENLFDALVPASISSGGIVERAQPRTIWLGLRLDFR